MSSQIWTLEESKQFTPFVRRLGGETATESNGYVDDVVDRWKVHRNPDGEPGCKP